jgi:hypothetical protein
MRKYEVNVVWTMLVPTNFKKIIIANEERDVLKIVAREVDGWAFEDWEKSNASTENIYFEEYNEIKISKIN